MCGARYPTRESTALFPGRVTESVKESVKEREGGRQRERESVKERERGRGRERERVCVCEREKDGRQIRLE